MPRFSPRSRRCSPRLPELLHPLENNVEEDGVGLIAQRSDHRQQPQEPSTTVRPLQGIKLADIPQSHALSQQCRFMSSVAQQAQ